MRSSPIEQKSIVFQQVAESLIPERSSICGGNLFDIKITKCSIGTVTAMSAVGARKGVLEVFKFGCYVSIPIVMMAVFAYSPHNLEKVIRNRSYVVYPPEGPRPPTGEEMREMLKKNKQ